METIQLMLFIFICILNLVGAREWLNKQDAEKYEDLYTNFSIYGPIPFATSEMQTNHFDSSYKNGKFQKSLIQNLTFPDLNNHNTNKLQYSIICNDTTDCEWIVDMVIERAGNSKGIFVGVTLK